MSDLLNEGERDGLMICDLRIRSISWIREETRAHISILNNHSEVYEAKEDYNLWLRYASCRRLDWLATHILSLPPVSQVSRDCFVIDFASWLSVGSETSDMLSEGIEDWDAFFLSLCLIQRSNLSQDRLVLADAILIPVLSCPMLSISVYSIEIEVEMPVEGIEVLMSSGWARRNKDLFDHQLQHRPSHSQETIKRMSEFAKDSLTLEETKWVQTIRTIEQSSIHSVRISDWSIHSSLSILFPSLTANSEQSWVSNLS